MNKGGFSWKRFLGVSSAKANLSRKIGVPLTKSGRQRKACSGDILSTLFTFFFDRRNGLFLHNLVNIIVPIKNLYVIQ